MPKTMLLWSVAIALAAMTMTARAGARPPAALGTERKALAAAVAAHDLAAIVRLSHFPLVIAEDQMPRTLSELTFLNSKEKFTDIFADGQVSTVECIRSDPLTYAADPKEFGPDTWSVDCNGYDYHFARRSARWLLIGFANINE